MKIKRAAINLTVYVDLDPVPGAFNTVESWEGFLKSLLEQSATNYDVRATINDSFIACEREVE